MGEDVVKVARFPSVRLEAVDRSQPGIGIDADSVGTVSNDVS